MIAGLDHAFQLLRHAMFAAAIAFAAVVAAVPNRDTALTYKGVLIDERRIPDDRRAELEKGLREQIDIVRSLPIRPKIADFLRSVPIRIDPALREPGHFDETGLRLWDKTVPSGNPVLLHELLHAWLGRATTEQRSRIRRAYDEARVSKRYPSDAYMMSDTAEFFTMTASVVLWGRAARLPFTRERVQTDTPDYFAWLVDTFGLDLTTASPSGDR